MGNFCGGCEDISSHLTSNGLREFSYRDMKAATQKFRADGKLGEGGFGCVYRGYLDEETLLPTSPGHGMTVAIKRLNPEGPQGPIEWETEAKLLGGLCHPNIVRLLGFCAEKKKRLLVYEYMSRGSLDNKLFHNATPKQSLSWNIRMRVALDAARGLAFLHDDQQHIIYRDFKAANILLDEHYNAKLSDLGLAREFPTGEDTHVTTRLLGTYGYAAPEYLATGHLTASCDVYSFGVGLLEILTGLRAMDEDRQDCLVEWAMPSLRSKSTEMQIMDPSLHGDYDSRVARRVASIAKQCVNDDAKNRPTMREVVESLEQAINGVSRRNTHTHRVPL